MKVFRVSWKLIFLSLILASSLAVRAARQQAYARTVATTLTRWPYLQQLTHESVHIIWTTDVKGSPSLEFGISRPHPTQAGIVSQLFSTPDANYYQHTAVITNLQPNTWYFYRIFDNDANLTPGLERWFKTAPLNGRFTFAAFGDSGAGSPEQYQLRDQMLSRWRDIDLFLHTGDLAYTHGTYTQFQNYFFWVYRDLLSFRPIFPAMGNHEYDTDNGRPYLNLFDLPMMALNAQEMERYYSFDWGYAHLVALDSETPLRNISEASDTDMADWLEADLASDDHTWKIAIIHRPLYSSCPNHPETDVREKLAPIFEEYGVDLVLSGHNHNYERSYPILNGGRSSLKDGGVVYIVTGGGGGAIYPAPGAWFTAAKAETHHFVQVEVGTCTMKLTVIDKQGKIIDRATLDKCPHQSYLPFLP